MISKTGPLKAYDIKTEFTGTEFIDVPISRYLRAPGGKYIQNVPPNTNIKKVKRNVAWSNYYGALNWQLKLGWMYAKAETPSQYHTNNDGEMTIVLSGTSPYYILPTRGITINQGTPYTFKGVDGDTGLTFTVLDGYQAASNGYQAPSYNILMRVGYGGGAASQGLFYLDPVYPEYSASAPAPIPHMWIYLPWHNPEDGEGDAIGLPRMRTLTLTDNPGRNTYVISKILSNVAGSTTPIRTPGGTLADKKTMQSEFMSDEYMYYLSSNSVSIIFNFTVPKTSTAAYRTKQGNSGVYSNWKKITVVENPNTSSDPTASFTWNLTNDVDTVEVQVANQDKSLLQVYTFVQE